MSEKTMFEDRFSCISKFYVPQDKAKATEQLLKEISDVRFEKISRTRFWIGFFWKTNLTPAKLKEKLRQRGIMAEIRSTRLHIPLYTIGEV